MNTDNVPSLIRISDYKMAKFCLRDLVDAFETARLYFSDEDFEQWQQEVWSSIARARIHPSCNAIQKVVDHLEEYKRRLGRQYAAKRDTQIALLYNDVECDIRWLVTQYECKRSSKPYYLTVK